MNTLATYTDEQARAIRERNVSVALSAGAGCGKTFVLTERFLSHLEPGGDGALQPAELHELVAITFTDRAAREMRDRIRFKCYARLQAAPPERAKYWLDLLRALDRARVSTIHSFCGSLLRSHAVEARIDPQFGVLEAAESATLAAESIDDCLRAGLAAHDADVLDLVTEVGLERLHGYLLRLVFDREALDNPRWRSMSPEELVAIWAEFHRETFVPRLLEQLSRSTAARTVLEILRGLETSHAVFAERRAALVAGLPRLRDSRHPAADLNTLREAAKVQGITGKKVWDDPELYEQYKTAATALRNEIDGTLKHLEFDALGALPAAKVGLQVLQVAVRAAEMYDAAKAELGCLDFGDLVLRACRLLTAPESAGLRRRLAGQIRLLLVDEFQDTNPLQVELVKALCGDDFTAGKLFFVGDAKQSIYRFLGADPSVFHALRGETPDAGRMPLTLNFRSQPAILEFVNALFCECFDEYEPLRPKRTQAAPRPAVEFLWPQVEEELRQRGHTAEQRRREADWIARRLRELLDAQAAIVADKQSDGGVRAVQPGDIAILFRALSDVQFYEEALRDYGIDYYLVGGHAFYAQQEVFDLLNLLRAVASPSDEVSLAGVLRSPFFSLADETLFWLAQHAEGLGGGLFARKLSRELGDNQRLRAGAAAATLRALRERKDRLPIAELVNEALDRTGYDAILLAEFLGPRKLANLRKLLDDARAFDRSGLFTLDDFIVQLSQFVANQPKEPLAAAHAESMNVVRLMTVHQAKGLEFPVVVVPDINRPTYGGGGSIEIDRRLGPLVKHDSDLPTCGYDLAQVLHRQEDHEETLRLLYVACTRAADYLILSACIPDFDKLGGDWTKLLAERFDLASGELLAKLPEGFVAPAVRVTTEEPPVASPRASRTRGPSLARLIEEAVETAQAGRGMPAPAVAPIPVDARARRQYSFSRLSGLLHGPFRPQAPPEVNEPDQAAVSPAAIDARGLGTLTHALLEELPLGEKCDVAALARRIYRRHVDDWTSEAGLAVELVERFLAGPRAAELARAKEVYREVEFLLAWPPGNVESGGLYLQGTIDCLYRDAGGRWRLLDFKTNQVAGDLAAVAERYELQLGVYALAAERILGEPPAELALCFLRPGTEYDFPWNDAARNATMGRLNQALECAVLPL